MATSTALLLSWILCLCFFIGVDGEDENVTSFDYNTTAYNDSTVTVTESSTTFEATEPTILTSTEQPAQPTAPSAQPMPESGRLPRPVTDVVRLCPCDQLRGECDINCCCDTDCVEELHLFTRCSVSTVSGNKQFCSCVVASYSLRSNIFGYSELQPSVRTETNSNIFCIRSQNRIDGWSHPAPTLPTDSNFNSLFEQSIFKFGSEETTAELQALSGYQYGDVMAIAGPDQDREMFWLPSPGVTADCVDSSPAAFLKDERRVCNRGVVLVQDCNTLPALNMNTYTDITLFNGNNKDAVVVPVEVTSAFLRSVNGTETEWDLSGGLNLRPVLLNSGLCANVVLKVSYIIKYNPAGEIVNVSTSLLLGFIREAVLSLQQEFHITFIQEGAEEVAVEHSGNPGYVVGLPLLSGTRTPDGIVQSIDPRETLSLLGGDEDQNCLQGQYQRTPVLFGVDSVFGCKLRLEDAANCSLLSQMLLEVLRGPNYPQYVASFGNPMLNNPMNWVQIKSSFSPGESQSCSIPLSLHLEIEWTKYGSLVNAQPQIVDIREIIQTNTSSLALLSGGCNILPIRVSVAFIPVSAPALPGYRAMPTIDAKLPFDFFFPFV